MSEFAIDEAGQGPSTALTVYQAPLGAPEPPPLGKAGRQALLGKLGSYLRTALTVWGAVSLTALGSYGIGAAMSGPTELAAASSPAQVGKNMPSPAVPAASSAPAGRVVAAAPARAPKPEPARARAPDRVEKEPSRSAFQAAVLAPAPALKTIPTRPATAAIAPAAIDVEHEAITPAEPDFAARLPRPRPDEPIVTGSIRSRYDARERRREFRRRRAAEAEQRRFAFHPPQYRLPPIFFFDR